MSSNKKEINRKQIKYDKKQEKYDKIIKEKTQKQKFRDQLRSIRVDTYTKALVAIITIVALIDLQLSYVLAFMNKYQIAESLSIQICITILGVSFIYMIRAYFDSKAEHNNEHMKKEMEKATNSKIQNILNNAGINIDIEGVLNNQAQPSKEGIHIEPQETNKSETVLNNDNNNSTPVG